ncbi:AT-hook motif nuclear-localized protein [Salix suchowensis]|nr:AT-hook motif nuclear-localized protein [Salix suchowensis]
METTVSSTSGGGGVTVVGSDAPSDYQIAPRSDSNPNSTPGSAPPALPQAPPPNPPSAAATTSVKKKRGRPRKYGPDGSVAVALSPKPISSAAPALSSPVIDFSAGKQKKIKPLSKAKYELENLGEWVACSVGANFTPHIITVNAGEDVTMKVISFSQQGPRAICILSANGVISSVTLHIVFICSFMPTETGGTRSRSGGMSVSLASPDGRVVGGGVAGLLVAASPVQVVVGSFLAGNQHEQKPKKQKHDSLSGVMLTAAIPISSADPKINFSSSSFRGDSWSSLPPDSRSKPADINVTLPAGHRVDLTVTPKGLSLTTMAINLGS